MSLDWSEILAGLDDGYRLCAPAGASDLDAVQLALATRLPVRLRELYLLTDGVFHVPGQWFVIWPVAEVVERNLVAYNVEGRSREKFVAFGDDGTGDPFCVPRDGGQGVFHWSPIEQQAVLLSDDVGSFLVDLTRDSTAD